MQGYFFMSNIDTAFIFSRSNPFYAANQSCWKRSLAAYSGGKKYIHHALIKHLSEIEPEFFERIRRAYYLNYPRKIARIITQYVLATRPERQNADTEIVEDFSRTGLRADEVMRQFSTYLNICGSAWLCVDMPTFEGRITKAQELSMRLRPYCVAMSPLQVVDWCYGPDGLLLWVLVEETTFDNSNPLEKPTEYQCRKLWTRNDVTIFSKNKNTTETRSQVIEHGLGVVPFIRHVEVDGYAIGENHWFEDVVRISDAMLNNESEAQMNTVKQMFGLLVLPEDFLDIVERQQAEAKLKGLPGEPISFTIARSAAIYESSEGKNVSRYISPDGAETASIRAENTALRKELYEVVGLAVSQDTKMVASAEAKAWDFQHIEQFMATRADVLEQSEGKAWELIHRWNDAIPVPTISYNRNFAAIDLSQSVATLLSLSTFNQTNDDYQREVNATAVTLLNRLRQLSQDKQEAILRAILASTPGSDNAIQNDIMNSLKNGKTNEGDPVTY